MVINLVLNAVFFLVSIALIIGWIFLIAFKPRIARVLFYVIAFPFFAFWAWGGWVITKEFGAAGYAMLAVGIALLVLTFVVFCEDYVFPALRRHNAS